MEALEQLLAQLLSGLAGHSNRSTDGLAVLREELNSERYFAVAKVFMIANQVAEPVCFDLALNDQGNIVGGQVLFALRDGRLPQGVGSREKLETVLLAYPHEAAAAVNWALGFERHNTAWVVQ
jgi:hypothetical protein